MKNKGSAPSGTGPFVIPINDIPKTTFYNLHQYLSSIFHASAYLFHGVRPRLDIIFQFYIAIDRPFSCLINKSTSSNGSPLVPILDSYSAGPLS